MTSEKYIDLLAAKLKTEASRDNAVQMKKYMKGLFPYYGLKAPVRNALLKEHIRNEGLPEDWREVIDLCWKWKERELQYIGMEIAYRSRKKWKKEDIQLFETIIVSKSWWDTVDFIASNIIGHYFFTYPDQIKPITNKWRSSKNLWLIRSCILFQLKYKEYTDFHLLQSLIHENKYSKEFFIQKAIGWSLRQYARIAPKEVRSFVTETELKPLSRREALKHFS